jgi:two-component system chemotaxis family response regulator WspR
MLRILLVDHDPATLDTMTTALEEAGHMVDRAASGSDALAIFHEQHHDLLIASIALPDLAGTELLRMIRMLKPDTHAVVMTGYETRDRAFEALKDGAFDYLEKPLPDAAAAVDLVRRVEASVQLEKAKQHLIRELQQGYEKLVREKRELERAASRDALTGLTNRRHLDRTIEQEVSRARRYQRSLSVIFLDIDHFKAYNDAFGHARGDEVLRAVGRILQENTRVSDTVARYGGEEFVVLLPEADEDAAELAAEKLRRVVEAAAIEGAPGVPTGHLTVSIGVAALASPLDGAGLIALADRALYASKASGRNRVTRASALDRAPEPLARSA